MQLVDFFNSAFALRLGLWVGRNTPPWLGYRLADAFTGLLARRSGLALCRIIDSNLRVVLGPEAPPELVAATRRRLLRNTGRAYYDFYHAVSRGREALIQAVELTPQAEARLSEAMAEQRGFLAVTPHLSNFEIAALAIAAQRAISLLALTWAAPTTGYELQNRIRSIAGLEWMPISTKTLREALRRLRSGGYVATAVDRPDPFGGGELLSFFGRPARLPVGHVRLALQTDTPILIANAEALPTPGRYRVHVVCRLEMERVGSRQENVLYNAQRVLKVVEGLIRAHPDQWQMFYPVWEEEGGRGR